MTLKEELEILRGEPIQAFTGCVCDYSLWSYIATTADVCFLNENVSVYRVHPGGITSYNLFGVRRDCEIIKTYFVRRLYGVDASVLVTFLSKDWFVKMISQKSMAVQHRAWRVLTEGGTKFSPALSRYERRVLFQLRIGLYRVWLETIYVKVRRMFPVQ